MKVFFFRISLFLSLVLIGVLLSGCTGSSTPTLSTEIIVKTQSLTLTALKAVPRTTTPITAKTQLVPAKTLTGTLPSTTQAAVSQSITPSVSGTVKTQAPTRTPTITRTPTNTRTPRPTKTPTNTRTPLPPPVHDAPIRIFSPSSLSKVSSPFTLTAAVLPGSRGIVHMQLIGEDGTTLVEKTWNEPSSAGWRMSINEKITFTPRLVAESARLVLYTYDEYNRLSSLATEDIILTQFGIPEMGEPDNLKDAFALFKPYPEQNLKNGDLVVDGSVRCRRDCRLVFELVDRDGEMVARFEDPDVVQASLNYTLFQKSYRVDVKSPTWVRLIMRQQDIFTAEDIYVSSMLIRILP